MSEAAQDWWDVAVEVSSAELALASVWTSLFSLPPEFADVHTMAAESSERDARIAGHAILRTTAADGDSALARCRAAVNWIVAQDERLSPANVEMTCTVTDGAAIAISATDDEDEDDPRPRADDPANFQPTVHPVAWANYIVTDDGRRLRISWMSGRYQLDRIEVHEDADKVTVSVHERHPPALNPDGSEGGILLVGKTHRAEVELAAPLGDRVVIDEFTGRTRRPARESA